MKRSDRSADTTTLMPISLFISTEIGRRTYGSRPDIPAPRLLGFAASRAVGFTALTF